METYVGKAQTIRAINQNIILNVIASNPGISQSEIQEKVDLSLSTVNKVVRSLEEEGLIICAGSSDFTGGRRSKVYQINEESGYIVSVYIQGDHFYCRVSNVLGKEIITHTSNYDSAISWSENLLKNLSRVILRIDEDKIDIIGVAVPGTVTKNRIFNIPAIPEWEGISLQELISEQYNCPVLIENDIKAAAMGAASKYLGEKDRNIAYISILEHIGSAIIINRELYNSSKSFAGELAYMAVSDFGKATDQTGSADLVLKNALKYEDKTLLIDLVAKLVVNVCCVIDPDTIIIATPHLVMDNLNSLQKCVSEYMHEDYTPRLVIDQVVVEENIQGMVTLCKHTTESAMRIVKV